MGGRPREPIAPETWTCTALLDGLRKSDNQTVWREYVERFRPRVLHYLARIGLSAQDAEDVAQEALGEFARSYRAGSYDRGRGRLRSWLFGIVQNHLRGANRRSAARVEGEPAGEAALDRIPDPVDTDELWEDAWRRALLHQALRRVRVEVSPETWAAFDGFGLQGRSASEVAEALGMSRANVFAAKRRVLDRVRTILPSLEAEE